MGEAKREWKCDQCGRGIEPIPEVEENEKCFLICEECEQKNKRKPAKFRVIERRIKNGRSKTTDGCRI